VNRALSLDQVQAIRERYAAGERVVDLAEEYGVGESTVRRLLTGETYADAGGPTGPLPHNRAEGHGYPGARARGQRRRRPYKLDLVLEAVLEHPGHSGSWYARHLGITRLAVMNALRWAEQAGTVRRTGAHRGTRWWAV